MNYLYFSLIVLILVGIAYGFWGYLWLNDITTTPKNPPSYVYLLTIPENKGRDLSYDPENAALQGKFYPDIKPLSLALSCEEAYQLVLDEAKKVTGWEVVSQNADHFLIEVIATTSMMKYQDDVAIALRRDAQGCSVHMRSKSRLGKGDLGANAHRIQAFFDQLQAKKK